VTPISWSFIRSAARWKPISRGARSKPAGIEAAVQSDTAGGEYPGMGVGRGFKIVVRDEDEPTAREILELPAREAGIRD